MIFIMILKTMIRKVFMHHSQTFLWVNDDNYTSFSLQYEFFLSYAKMEKYLELKNYNISLRLLQLWKIS